MAGALSSSLYMGTTTDRRWAGMVRGMGALRDTAEALGLLVALSLLRELGPVVTALLFAGRAGTALTAEIGLMKAMGMSGGKIFGLFSAEAVLIGVFGSVAGVIGGVAVGSIANALLTGEGGALAEVSGLSLYAIAPLQLLVIVLVIMLIAFLAGTLPAARAAKKDPIEALRYE